VSGHALAADGVSAPRTAPSLRRIASAGAIGNLIEWYDWSVYAFFAPVLATEFFPAHNRTASMLLIFATFAVGFVMRPLGGLLLGPIGDRHGRTALLAATIGLMGGAALVIAICPAYDSIGVAAPIILVLARLVQGVSAGGEFGGAVTYLVENAPANRRGFIGSFQQVSTGLGALLASGTGAIVTAAFTTSQVNSFGWRLPFVLGAVLSLVGLWLRRGVGEGESFQRVERDQQRPGMFEAIVAHPAASLRVVGIVMVETLTYYVWLTYLPTYAHEASGIPLSTALAVNTATTVVFVVLTPVAGILSDRVGRKPLMIVPTICFAVLTWPLLRLVGNGEVWALALASLIAAVLSASYSGVIVTLMAEQFPTRVRTAGVAAPAALGVALFGGTAPLIITSWSASGVAVAGIAIYTLITAVISGVVYVRMRETAHATLT
jgi:MHS family alpha-ketoglutarate permease-like MFS transporter